MSKSISQFFKNAVNAPKALPDVVREKLYRTMLRATLRAWSRRETSILFRYVLTRDSLKHYWYKVLFKLGWRADFTTTSAAEKSVKDTLATGATSRTSDPWNDDELFQHYQQGSF